MLVTMDSLSTTHLVLLISALSLATCLPTQDGISRQKRDSFVASSSNTLSAANGYQVMLKEENVNGDCESRLIISGNGLHKLISYPCKSRPHAVINLNKTLLVGDEWYSDEYGVLIRLVDGKCSREVYQEKEGAYTSSTAPMEIADCEKVKLKIGVLKEQQARWEEWYKQKQEEAQNQLTQIQTNLMSLQQNLLGGLFSGLPWGIFGKK